MKKNFSGLLLFFVIIMLIASCKAAEKESAETEEFVDTGSLSIESFPSLAQVYIGEEYKGDTPVMLYNLPVGEYLVTIKKERYMDFQKTATIKVGKIEELDATLTPIKAEEAEAEKPAERQVEAPEKTSRLNKINLSSFAMYYDFDKAEFTELRASTSDLFSRKYDTYVHFTALTPAKINILDKPINDVEREDCIFGDTQIVTLFSGQTLCVSTAEGAVAAIGGNWQTMPAELEWKLFD